MSGVLATDSFLIVYLKISLGIFAWPVKLYTFLRAVCTVCYWALLATFINISSFIIINNFKRLSSNFRSFILAFTDLKVMLLVPLHVS